MLQILNRKKRLKKILINNYNESSTLLYLLISTNKLDNIIKHLDNIKTITNTKCIVKKGYLTSEEQFISIIEYIITKFHYDFWFLKKYSNTLIEFILTQEEILPLLLCKKYINNNEYITYYDIEFKKACITNFYKILQCIDKTNIIYSFFKDNQIILDKFEINNMYNVNSLYQVLRLLCICNRDSYGLLYLFNDCITESTTEKNKNMYRIQLEILIEKTFELQDSAIKLL